MLFVVCRSAELLDGVLSGSEYLAFDEYMLESALGRTRQRNDNLVQYY